MKKIPYDDLCERCGDEAASPEATVADPFVPYYQGLCLACADELHQSYARMDRGDTND